MGIFQPYNDKWETMQNETQNIILFIYILIMGPMPYEAMLFLI